MPDRKLSRQEIKEILYRRRYVVPNAVTVGNMFCGFISILYASSGRFEKAIVAILIAILLDGLDGRVARKLNATSKFGIEFDSFSDLVSFGVAPAVLTYHWAFDKLADEFGVAMAFFFALCSASRLARFNISAENLKSFSGLPTPGAAAFIVAAVNSNTTPPGSYLFVLIGSLLMVIVGYLMVSTIEFASIKQFRLSGVRLKGRLVIGLAIALTWYNFNIGFLLIASAYVLSGPYLRVRDQLPRWAGGIRPSPNLSNTTKVVNLSDRM